jgi:hypothetical protein
LVEFEKVNSGGAYPFFMGTIAEGCINPQHPQLLFGSAGAT